VPTDRTEKLWTIRSTLIAVADLDEAVAFYGEIGPFTEIARLDAVVVLGSASPGSIALLLRETRSLHHTRHGQQSLGLRSITFNVGSLDELNRIESVLRGRDLFTSRQQVADAAELLRGRDPDNQPLVFVCYTQDEILPPDYYQAVASLVYALDT
jgi:hypothetical protein